MEQWNSSMKGTVELDDPHGIIKAFKKGFELEETYWTYRSLYLSSAKQSQGESVATLTTRVKDLVNMSEWPEDQKEQWRIDLFYHLTDFFDVKCYAQNETARDSGNLMWEKLTEEAQASRMCWQGVCQVQEREQWQWHTILWRSSLGHRCNIQWVQEAPAEITDTIWR